MTKILIQKSFKGSHSDFVTFETEVLPEEVLDFSKNTFDHHGINFPPFFPSSVQMLYESLILGRSLPDMMLMNHIRHYANVLGPCFFMFRDMIFSERASELVSIIDRIERWGNIGFVGIPLKIEMLLAGVSSFIPNLENEKNISEKDLGDILKAGMEIFHSYLANGTIPNVRLPTCPEPKILEKSDDYVIVEITSLKEIDQLYQSGFRCGLCFWGDKIVLFRRSIFIEAPLEKIANRIGEYEKLDNFFILSYNGERSFVISLCHKYLKGY